MIKRGIYATILITIALASLPLSNATLSCQDVHIGNPDVSHALDITFISEVKNNEGHQQRGQV